MRKVGFFSKKMLIVLGILFVVIGALALRLLAARDMIVKEHVGKYLTHVATSEADLVHPQAWAIRFEGKEGVLERYQINCDGEVQKIGSEPIYVIDYSKGPEPVAQGSLTDSINSHESYKFAVRFRIPKEQDLECTMVYVSEQRWSVVTCYEHSNVFRYATMKISDQCEDKIRKLSL
ncbi:MAG: hypothetical protein WA160_02235 [Pseudobdellovibrio sp.]